MSDDRLDDCDLHEEEWLEEWSPLVYHLLRAIKGDEESLVVLEDHPVFHRVAQALLAGEAEADLLADERDNLAEFLDVVADEEVGDWLENRCTKLHLFFRAIRRDDAAVRRLLRRHPDLAPLIKFLARAFRGHCRGAGELASTGVASGAHEEGLNEFEKAFAGIVTSTSPQERAIREACARAFCQENGLGRSRDTRAAARWYRKAADLGDLDSQERLGVMHFRGEGLRQDYERAAVWFRRPAEQGYLSSQLYLAIIHLEGLGVPADEAEALRWIQRPPSRVTFHPGGLYFRIGRHFWERLTLPEIDRRVRAGGSLVALGAERDRNHALAVPFFQQAARYGHAGGCYGLSLAFESGIHVPRNEEQALAWLRKAADGGHPRAQYSLAQRYQDGDGVETDAAIAVRWLRAAAECGVCEAQHELALCYLDGQGVEPSDREAVWWLRLAAASDGDPTYPLIFPPNLARVQSMETLGAMLLEGRGTSRDEREAVRLLRIAAEAELSVAANLLGVCYFEGTGVEQNHAEGVRWFQAASEQGNIVARRNLARCYRDGAGVTRDHNRAAELMLQSVVSRGEEYPEAQCDLGTFYEEGIGVTADRAEALKWYYKAALNGDPDAIAKVVEFTLPFHEVAQ